MGKIGGRPDGKTQDANIERILRSCIRNGTTITLTACAKRARTTTTRVGRVARELELTAALAKFPVTGAQTT